MTDQRDLAAEAEDIRRRHSSTVIHGWGGEDVDTLLAYIDLLSKELEEATQQGIDAARDISQTLTARLDEVEAENQRLINRLDLFYEQTDCIEQQLGIEPESITKTIGGEIERLQSDLAAALGRKA